MNRLARVLPLALAVLLSAGCSDALGPLFGIEVEIRGPDRLIGQWNEASSWEGVPAGYRCEPRLTLVARGRSSSKNSPLVWNSMTIYHYDSDGQLLGEPQIYTGRRLDFMLGYLSGSDQILTDRIAVVADTLPFRWKLVLRYYDPDTGRNGSASFSSRCLGS